MRGLIGKKMGMTRIYDENGLIVPVTLIQAGPCTVTQIKTDEKDGYEAVQVGYGERKPKHTTKPLLGHFDSAGVPAQKVLAEFDKVQVLNIKQGKPFTLVFFRKVTMSVFLVRPRGKDLRALLSGIIFPGRRKHMVRGIQKGHRDLSGRHQIRPAYFLG